MKSPKGIAGAPFRPRCRGRQRSERPTSRSGSVHPTRGSDPVADDAADHEHHAQENDEVSEVLTDRETGDDGLRGMGDEVVLDEVEQEAERDDREPEACRGGKSLVHRSLSVYC
jgi:hypothetical protein